MPCPLFEPLERTSESPHPTARLPLIYEFTGVCHAGETTIGEAHRFEFCNRGYARGNCAHFPGELALSALRFDVTSRTACSLNVLVVEEENHWPRAWNRFEFQIQDERLVPEIEDVCRRAQVFAFCRSYLDKF